MTTVRGDYCDYSFRAQKTLTALLYECKHSGGSEGGLHENDVITFAGRDMRKISACPLI